MDRERDRDSFIRVSDSMYDKLQKYSCMYETWDDLIDYLKHNKNRRK
jgi:hypothetical protein